MNDGGYIQHPPEVIDASYIACDANEAAAAIAAHDARKSDGRPRRKRETKRPSKRNAAKGRAK